MTRPNQVELTRLSDELILRTLHCTNARALGLLTMSSTELTRLAQVALYEMLHGATLVVQLRLHETIGQLPCDHSLLCAYFNQASFSLRAESKHSLHETAALILLHPAVRCEIHGHVHIGAPAEVATYYSIMRARAVRDRLAKCGVDPGRCSITGWGKTVARAEGWPATQHYSRVELRLSVNGMSFPACRPVYKHLDPPEQNIQANDEPTLLDASEDSSEEEQGQMFNSIGLHAQLTNDILLMLLAQQQDAQYLHEETDDEAVIDAPL